MIYLKYGRLATDLRVYSGLLIAMLFACSALYAQVYLVEIDFPEDAAAACGDRCIPAIRYIDEGCAMLLVNRDTARFNASSDECYKLAITYDVIDWCLWNGEYAGTLIRRRTEDDDNTLPIDRGVERSERPVLRLQGSGITELDVTLNRRHNTDAISACGNTDDGSQLPINDIDYPTADNVSFRGDLFGGRWRYTQFIKVYDHEPPVVEVPAYGGPTDECPQLAPRQFGDVFGSCDTEVTLLFSATDACDLLDDSADDVVLWSAELAEYVLDVNNDGRIDANEFAADYDAGSQVTTLAVGAYRFRGSFPIMQADQLNRFHTLRVQFTDGCGNRSSAYLPFQVIDCKGPAPSCVNGLTTRLHPQPEPRDVDADGLVDHCLSVVRAAHFEASPIYDCTGQGPETEAENVALLQVDDYAIYTDDVASQAGFVPQATQDSLFITEHLNDTVLVRVYTFDRQGNYDYCTTYVSVDSSLDCEAQGGSGNLAGWIHTEYDEPIEGVAVAVSGQQEVTQETAEDGNYLLSNLQIGNDYTITPGLHADVDNGVTTFDIVLINKHILGIEPLGSPYAIIAADVNHSESVTVRDIIQLRKVILGMDTAFANNTSWRFVPENYVFPDPSNPWAHAFPELISVNDLSGSEAYNFVGIKVGDVNQSARANRL